MIKFKQGYITNPKTGMTKEVVVKSLAPNNLKDILIGGGIVIVGITYLTTKAFKNGSMKYEDAEFQTFTDLNLIED